jgi:chlorite dismutase
MPDAPVTLEGWYTLHDVWSVDWPAWNALAAVERTAIVAEAREALAAIEQPADGESACYAVLSQKGDLMVVHWRRDLEALRAVETAFATLRLRTYLVPTYSYLAALELGTYELQHQAAAALKKQGLEPGAEGWDEAHEREMHRIAAPRLYAKVPDRRYLCFYPMSKRRGEQVRSTRTTRWSSRSSSTRCASTRRARASHSSGRSTSGFARR